MPIVYKCPGCGSVMEFDSATQGLKCPNCDMQIGVEEYEDRYKEQMDNSSAKSESGEESGMKIYHCQSCGAELVADEYTSATFCSFCGNPTLVEDRLNGSFEPSLVIPFKIDKNQARETYRSWVKKGKLTPKSFSRESTIEKISGIYVPFWLFNYEAESRMNVKAENVRREVHGKTEYVYTDHYEVYRDVRAEFNRIPADASEKMDDDTMDKLEPFEYSDMVPFSKGYLSGYLSERYNYTDEELSERIEKRVKQYITDITRGTIVGYDSVSILSNNVDMSNLGNKYALFPVWILNYRYKGKNFTFALNGQTGKIVANHPVSVGKALAFGALFFVISLIITMLGGLIFV